VWVIVGLNTEASASVEETSGKGGTPCLDMGGGLED
jgi:hypothetical protein